MQCPKCKHEADSVDFGPERQCPSCGAYYDKALRYANGEREHDDAPARPSPALADRVQSAQAAVASSRERRRAFADHDLERRLNPFYAKVTGVEVPFLSLVWLMTKVILAAIPAVILASIIVIVTVSVIDGAITAYKISSITAPSSTPAVGRSGLSSEEVAERCKSIEQYAEKVMEARQAGADMSTFLAGANSDVLTSIVVAAYERGRYNSLEIQQRTITDFKNDRYLKCIQALR